MLNNIIPLSFIIDINNNEKIDFLYKNNIMILVFKYEIESAYQTHGKKKIYKVKYNIKNKIFSFKAR